MPRHACGGGDKDESEAEVLPYSEEGVFSRGAQASLPKSKEHYPPTVSTSYMKARGRHGSRHGIGEAGMAVYACYKRRERRKVKYSSEVAFVVKERYSKWCSRRYVIYKRLVEKRGAE